MTYIRANGTVLNVELRGRGEPVVLLPDIGEDLTSWSYQMGFLASRHFVLALDNRGSGWSDSPAPPYTVEVMAQDAVAAMELIGVEHAHLVGHGLGGMIAQAVAARHPGRARSLTTVCTPPRPTDTQRSVYRDWVEAGAEGRDPLAISELMTPWIFSPRFLENERWREHVVRGRAKHYRWTSWEGVRHQLEAMLRHRPEELLPRISCPALVVWGRDDRLVPPASAQELAERLGQARAVELEGGHMLPLELMRSLIKEEMGFMAETDGTPPPCFPSPGRSAFGDSFNS